MLHRLILILLLIAGSSSGLVAQWKQVFVGSGKPVYSIYFLDLPGPPRIGFASTGTGIWRTNDGGVTWSLITASSGGAVDFTFKDSLVGWYASRGLAAVFKTIDGGFSWFPVVVPAVSTPSGEGIYYNPKTHLLFLASWSIGVWSSDDDGNIWKQISDQRAASGISFDRTLLHGLVSYSIDVSSSPYAFLFTNDGGLSWQYSQTKLYECWQTVALNDGKTYVGVFEGQGNGVKRSEDGGNTWQKADNFKLNMNGTLGSWTGDIRGNDCRVYGQTTETRFEHGTGIVRSLDQFQTFQFLGGPKTSYFDRRFWVRDRHIYAGDTLGNIFYLYDTIGTVHSAVLQFDSNMIVMDTVNECTPGKAIIHLSDRWVCDSIRIVKMGWVGNGGKYFNVNTPTDLPRWVAPGIGDSIVVNFPTGNNGTFSASLRITIKHDSFTQDTIIVVKGIRTALPAATLSHYQLRFDTISTCSSKTLKTTVINTGCDTDIVSVPGTPTNGYSLISPSSPVRLNPGDTTVIEVQLFSNQIGVHSSTAKIQVSPLHHPAISFDISLDGFIEQRLPSPSIYPISLNFDSISLCDTSRRQLSITLSNRSACDSLHIDSLWIEGETTLFTTNHTNRTVIAPSDSDKVLLSFKAGTRGNHNADVHFRYYDGITEHDTIIPMQGFVSNGAGVLSINTPTIDFGTTSLCNERDTIIRLSNTGCDSLRIDSLTLSGIGFTLSGVSLPVTIAIDSSISFGIDTKIDSIGAKTNNSGSVIIHSNSGLSNSPITLSRNISYPRAINVHLEAEQATLTAGERAKFKLKSDKTDLAGITTLDIDLNYNQNLLAYQSSNGQNTVTSTDGKSFHIQGSPIISLTTDSMIAELSFNVFLTTDSVTSLSLSNLHLNKVDPTFEQCVASVSASGGSSFEYRFVCGDHLIRDILNNTLPFRIISVYPNPTSSELTINIESSTKQKLKVEITNSLGIVIETKQTEIENGKSEIKLLPGDWSEGLYFLRVYSELGVASEKVLKLLR